MYVQRMTPATMAQEEVVDELEAMVGAAVLVHVAGDRRRHEAGRVFGAILISIHSHGLLLQRGRYKEFLSYADLRAGHAHIESISPVEVAAS